ncbi:MAG: PorV/PorQ family protein [bacterium]|nr:PorV/PorQ family protein [Candidatus Kapabacteria bacterium]
MTYSQLRHLLFISRLTASRLCLIALLATIASSSMALAQGYHNAKYASEFLSFGAGARSGALGGAGTALNSDVTAGYYNPAGLSGIKHLQAAIFHESRFSGEINYDYIGAALPLDSLQTFAVSAIRLGYDDIPDTRDALIDPNGNGRIDDGDRIDPTRVKYGGASDWAIFGSYARRVNDKLSVGGNLKLLYKTVLDHIAWGLGIDLSAHYTPVDNLSLGATLADATKSLMTWDTGNQEFLVPQLKLGAAYRYDITDDHGVMPILDVVLRFEGRETATMLDLGLASADIGTGLEYSYRDRVFVRGGYSELGQLTVGAGVKLPKLNIDYAFLRPRSEDASFGSTHRVSLRLTLEEDRFARGK